jgi:hypothetical protein
VSTLNITNGDHAGDKLKMILDGPVITAADVLHEGPCPAVDGDAWHDARARFLSDGGYASYQDIKQGLAATDRTIAEACARDQPIVLWFEHDLFDQLALIRTLDLMVRLKPDTTGTSEPATTDAPSVVSGFRRTLTDASPVVSGFSRTLPHASLICIGAFPGIDRFIGLGQLTPNQLATLKGRGVPLTAGHFGLAVDAWRAFRSPDPSELFNIAQQLTAAAVGGAEGTPAFVFLGDALLRFLAEYPSTANGLTRTEEQALEALADGPKTGAELFGASQAKEARPFMGDSTFFDIVHRLAMARVPLVTIEGSPADDMRKQKVTLTPAGRDVLDNKADHVGLNGIDGWRGGVHLTGTDTSQWRWDRHRETLVS